MSGDIFGYHIWGERVAVGICSGEDQGAAGKLTMRRTAKVKKPCFRCSGFLLKSSLL